MTLGFSEQAKLDEGHLWPASFALRKLAAAAATIGALVMKAAG